MRKAPSLRNNNGSLQVRVRLDGKDHFINRLGRWDDPIAVAKAQAISAAIWRDYREGTLDWSLCRYKPLVEGKDPDLLKALEDLMLRKRQGRTTHAYRSKPGEKLVPRLASYQNAPGHTPHEPTAKPSVSSRPCWRSGHIPWPSRLHRSGTAGCRAIWRSITAAGVIWPWPAAPDSAARTVAGY